MVSAVIFAGGTGQRMNTKTIPKQLLKLHGKPIIIYTLEQFQRHQQVDSIIVVMLEKYITQCAELVEKYGIDKVSAIVPGGETVQVSIHNGLRKATELLPEDSIVLIHDGVRPMIDEMTISEAISCTTMHGSAITVSPAIETIALEDASGKVGQIIDRSKCRLAKAPQCFILRDILSVYEKAALEGKKDFIDSASLMQYYGHELYMVEGLPENIKITTPADFFVFRAIIDAKENSQIFGI